MRITLDIMDSEAFGVLFFALEPRSRIPTHLFFAHRAICPLYLQLNIIYSIQFPGVAAAGPSRLTVRGALFHFKVD